MREASGIVVLTNELERLFRTWYADELVGKAMEIIPCCVDTRSMPTSQPDLMAVRKEQCLVFVYAGKLGGWYPTREMVDFVITARQIFPNLTWRVLTQCDPEELRAFATEKGLSGSMSIDQVAPDALPGEFSKARLGLCFYRRKRSAEACSPTKVAEYLAAGLPVVATAGIGDTDAVLTNGGCKADTSGSAIGVLIDEPTVKAYKRAAIQIRSLLDDPDTPQRCRAVAQEYFDLQRVGWARYTRIYEALIGQPDSFRERGGVEHLIEPRVGT